MRDPSGLKAAENTEPSCPRNTAVSFALAAFPIPAVLSPDTVTKAAISVPVVASQIRAVLSYEAVTMRKPVRSESGGPHKGPGAHAAPRFPSPSRFLDARGVA